jgi:hypothetical protein
VAILDRGRLVLTAPTAELVQRSSGGTIQVGLVGSNSDVERALAAIPGVDQVRVAGRDGDEWRYELTPAAGATGGIQQAVTRLAGELGLALTTNRQETLDLEDIFLRIVNEERAA